MSSDPAALDSAPEVIADGGTPEPEAGGLEGLVGLPEGVTADDLEWLQTQGVTGPKPMLDRFRSLYKMCDCKIRRTSPRSGGNPGGQLPDRLVNRVPSRPSRFGRTCSSTGRHLFFRTWPMCSPLAPCRFFFRSLLPVG